MKQNLSDWMDEMWDEADLASIDLADPHITTPDRIYAIATGAVPTGKPAKNPRPGRRVWRTALIAAAMVALLSATAIAVYQYRVEDTFLPVLNSEETAATAQPNVYTTSDGTEMVQTSLMGFQDSSEYQAQVAWYTYLAQWNEEYPNGDWFYQKGVDDSYFETPENECYFYDAYAPEQGETLEAIAQEYGLTLHTARMVFSGGQELYDLLGIDTPLLDESIYSLSDGYLYDDGSFYAYGSAATSQGEIGFDMVSAVHGSFTCITGRMETAYETWDHTTADGVAVILALSENQAEILVDLDDTFLTVSYWSNSAENEFLSRETLEQLADGLCLSRFQTLYTAESQAAIQEQVQTAYDQARAQQEEEQAQQTFTTKEEKVAAVQDVLGEYHISIPGYQLRYTNATHPAEDTTLRSALQPTYLYEAIDTYLWAERPNNVLGDTISFGYSRVYTDAQGTQSITSQTFFAALEETLEYWKTSGAEVCECTVLGYDGYTMYQDHGNNEVEVIVLWLDTDRDLGFTITYTSYGLEDETVLTVDEVVALADTIECVE